jgi:membrane protein YqaA with SNARE-associated domain
MSFWHKLIQALLAGGPFGVLVLALLDSTGLPVVGGVDTLLVAVATTQPKQAYPAAFLAVLGSLIGSLILFFIARKGGEVLLAKHISRGLGARLHVWFQRYGLVTVFVPAVSPIPLPMKVPVFCAGALNVRLFYFFFVVAVARLIRYFALAYLGQHYGKQTGRFLLAHAWQIGAAALALGVAVAVGIRVFQKHEAAVGRPE